MRKPRRRRPPSRLRDRLSCGNLLHLEQLECRLALSISAPAVSADWGADMLLGTRIHDAVTNQADSAYLGAYSPSSQQTSIASIGDTMPGSSATSPANFITQHIPPSFGGDSSHFGGKSESNAFSGGLGDSLDHLDKFGGQNVASYSDPSRYSVMAPVFVGAPQVGPPSITSSPTPEVETSVESAPLDQNRLQPSVGSPNVTGLSPTSYGPSANLGSSLNSQITTVVSSPTYVPLAPAFGAHTSPLQQQLNELIAVAQRDSTFALEELVGMLTTPSALPNEGYAEPNVAGGDTSPSVEHYGPRVAPQGGATGVDPRLTPSVAIAALGNEAGIHALQPASTTVRDVVAPVLPMVIFSTQTPTAQSITPNNPVLSKASPEVATVPLAMGDTSGVPALTVPQYQTRSGDKAEQAAAAAGAGQVEETSRAARGDEPSTAATVVANGDVVLDADASPAALLTGLPMNMEAVDQALAAMAREIEKLGGELATWFDDASLSTWSTVAIVVTATGVGGGYLWRQRNRGLTDDTSEEESSSWLFSRLHSPAGPA
jgi:hypothetical protein